MLPRALLAALVLTLALSGCSGKAPSTEAGPGPGGHAQDAMDGATLRPGKGQVTDDVAFTGTLGASACAFDGSSAQCANVAGSNVLRHEHDRVGALLGGQLTVTFTPASDAGMGPWTSVFIADDCPSSCHLVKALADGTPAGAVPSGPTGSYEIQVPAGLVLDNQTLVVRVAPLHVTSVASASPTYDVTVAGSLEFEVEG